MAWVYQPSQQSSVFILYFTPGIEQPLACCVAKSLFRRPVRLILLHTAARLLFTICYLDSRGILHQCHQFGLGCGDFVRFARDYVLLMGLDVVSSHVIQTLKQLFRFLIVVEYADVVKDRLRCI